MKLTLLQVADWTGAELLLPQADDTQEGTGRAGVATGYSIDTRTLQSGDLFFAVRGERFDAHDFLPAAFTAGACAAVVARERVPELPQEARMRPLLAVNDPLEALQTLASAVRRHWKGTVVGVTGSAGKTTTKEAIAAVLAAKFRVLKSKGNLNNHYGLPLQLLKLEPDDEVAVIEMGMSAAGEIARLAEIAQPDWGVVTNVGTAHAENFADGRAGIARAKRELVESLPGNGVAFLNADDAYVAQFGRGLRSKIVSFGLAPEAEVRAEDIEELGACGSQFRVVAGDKEAEVRLALLGRHNVTNALAAIAVGLEAGIPLDRCAAALSALEPQDKRGEVIAFGGATIINDVYNSNPEALRSMIRTLAAVPAERRILVAGEMLELGPQAEALHASCGHAAAEAGIDVVVGVRGLGRAITSAAGAAGAVSVFAPTPEEAGEWLRANLRPGDAVLLKASRGVRLERALEVLRAGQETLS